MKFELLARKGTKEILYALSEKDGMKFTELKTLVGSPTTASQRLQELAGAGVVEREVQADRYRSVKYSLTKKGMQTVKLMKELDRF